MITKKVIIYLIYCASNRCGIRWQFRIFSNHKNYLANYIKRIKCAHTPFIQELELRAVVNEQSAHDHMIFCIGKMRTYIIYIWKPDILLCTLGTPHRKYYGIEQMKCRRARSFLKRTHTLNKTPKRRRNGLLMRVSNNASCTYGVWCGGVWRRRRRCLPTKPNARNIAL